MGYTIDAGSFLVYSKQLVIIMAKVRSLIYHQSLVGNKQRRGS